MAGAYGAAILRPTHSREFDMMSLERQGAFNERLKREVYTGMS
ncbi:MAG: hypothetical protein ABI703_06910 [Gemmatimonadales bacterium]